MLVHTPRVPVFYLLLAGLSGLAWLALFLWGQSPYARFLNHAELDAVHDDRSVVMLLFVAGWMLMTMAMMLPTSLPLVALFRGLLGRRPDRVRLVGLLVLGYVSVWTVFGFAVHAGDAVLHVLVASQAWLSARADAITAVTLVGAGVYQFTPLKFHCLDRCRSPMAFIVGHWRGRRPASEAFGLGVSHGLFCVGCCWSLMLLMFAMGMGSLGWMLVLGATMAVEKNMPWGRRLSAPLGAVLLGCGLVLAVVKPWP
jgi:predicted metal-binding membrane protein